MGGADSDSISRADALNRLGERTEQRTPERRGILKTAAAGIASIAASAGFTGLAAAADPDAGGRVSPAAMEEAKAAYEGEAAARAIEESGLLSVLAERGYIETATLSELGRPDVSGTVWEGTATAHIVAADEVDGREVAAVVQPQLDREYAVVRDGSAESTVIDPGNPEPQGCYRTTGYLRTTDCRNCFNGLYNAAKVEVECCDIGSCYVVEEKYCPYEQCTTNSSCEDLC
jgi:hypothetical protein